jgi:hypothetical protein
VEKNPVNLAFKTVGFCTFAHCFGLKNLFVNQFHFMKRIFGVLLLIIGSVLSFLGMLFKLESWELANEMLLLGVVLGVVGGIMLFSKAISQMGKGAGSSFKIPLLIIAAGVVLVFVGAASKLESWNYASELLILGNLVQVIGLGWLVFKVLTGRK